VDTYDGSGIFTESPAGSPDDPKSLKRVAMSWLPRMRITRQTGPQAVTDWLGNQAIEFA